MDQIENINEQVHSQAVNKICHQVRFGVWEKFRPQVMAKMSGQVWHQINNKFYHKVVFQVYDGIGNKVVRKIEKNN
jgi:hypothetical protein